MREYRELSTLSPWANNPRAINKEDFVRLKKQISRLGQYKPLLITQDGTVLGGNMRLRAMQELAIDKAWVSVVEFRQKDDAWVAVVDGKEQPETFPTERQALTEYALSDNDRAGYYQDDKLAEMMFSLPALDPDLYKFDMGRLTSVKELMSKYGPDPEDDDFDPIPPEEPVTQPGDLYILGNHRLLCGDSTKIEDVKRLMDGKRASMVFTDPPYNVAYTGGMGGDGDQHKRKAIANDNMKSEEFYQFLYDAMVPLITFTKGAIYVCMSSSELHNLWKAFTDAGGHWQTYIIWAKDTFTLSRSDYQHQFEPILHGLTPDQVEAVKEAGDDLESLPILYGWTKHDWYGGRKQGDVWRIDRPKVSREHPTMKPVALVTKAVRNSSLVGQIVLDTFGGSGTTLIACEQLDRPCYMMELDPGYCDVIVRRWETLTGKKAEVKHGASGQG